MHTHMYTHNGNLNKLLTPRHPRPHALSPIHPFSSPLPVLFDVRFMFFFLAPPEFSLRGRGGPRGVDGWGCGGDPPPAGAPDLLEAPKALKKIFWPKLSCAEGARENF